MAVKKVKVYRIEDAEGAGPYVGGSRYAELYGKLFAHNIDGAHPSVERDCGFWTGVPKDFYCGFKSAKQYRVWFDGFFDLLVKYKFYLVQYEVPADKVVEGSKQVAFVKSEAKKLKKFLPNAKNLKVALAA